MSERHPPARALPAGLDAPLLVLGVVAVSFSAVLIREADAPPLTIALYRNVIATLLLLPFALGRHRAELRSLTRRQIRLAFASGALLAAHFALWIPSLEYTSVAASVVLVTTQPVWTALGGRVLYGERLQAGTLGGIGLALAGALIITGGDIAVSGRAAFGDLLAIGGAVAAAGYFLIGRNLRQELSLVPYVTVVYATCSLLLVPVVLISGSQLIGFPAKTWWMFLLMALVPQIMGHTVFNYLLRFMDPTVVAIAIMGEPVGATLLALAFYGETPPWSVVVGGAIVLAGIYVAIRAQGRRRTVPEAVVE
ncbi:MAG TPA: DMT family transporter [Actinomycetota bacterium]|nr:DMT family transporter [Actinomycetota bacterium]